MKLREKFKKISISFRLGRSIATDEHGKTRKEEQAEAEELATD